MEEEVCYSSVTFIKSEEAKPREKQIVEETVYAEVKKKETQTEPSVIAETADDKPLPRLQRYRYAVVGLGLLTALLLSALVALLVYYQIYVSEYNTLLVRELHQLKGEHTFLLTNLTLVSTLNLNLSNSNKMLQVRYENASAANQHLHSEMVQLQEEKERLIVERNHLNETLEVIFQYSVFPVDHFCPERKCSGHCNEGWLYYQSSCYQFIYSNDWSYLTTWENSKANCAKSGAHLVTIDTIEEQAFINNHTRFYQSNYYGYWIGLSKVQGKWMWVDGKELTEGYWISTWYDKCAVTMPSTDPSNSWKDRPCESASRWICEMKAAMWPD